MPLSVMLIKFKRVDYNHGWCSEVYNKDKFSAVGIDEVFVQDNRCPSLYAASFRRPHFQVLPHAKVRWLIAYGATPPLSTKDEKLSVSAEFDSSFVYDGVPLSFFEVYGP
jgi:dTDP-4-dehydrorhamnose 3,5-epimerase-like enzyme